MALPYQAGPNLPHVRTLGATNSIEQAEWKIDSKHLLGVSFLELGRTMLMLGYLDLLFSSCFYLYNSNLVSMDNYGIEHPPILLLTIQMCTKLMKCSEYSD